MGIVRGDREVRARALPNLSLRARRRESYSRDTRYIRVHGLLTQRLEHVARPFSLAPHAVNATRSRRACVRECVSLTCKRANAIHVDCAREGRYAALARSGAPYTPRSRSGMNETMISTHGAKVGDSSGGARRGAKTSRDSTTLA